MNSNEQATVSYFIQQSKQVEESSSYAAKSWLLTGRSLLPNCFQIHFQSYELEKRLENVDGAAQCFELLFVQFLIDMKGEVGRMADAVRSIHMTKNETDEQQFLYKIFTALRKNVQMEILMQRTEHTDVHFEKCQFMLLLVQLFPDTINVHGSDLLFTLLACENDVHSTFRKLFVVELVPAVVRLGKSIANSPSLISLLYQCVEYYVLVPSDSNALDTSERWNMLFSAVDSIGTIMSWDICPFFSGSQSQPQDVETLYQALQDAYKRRGRYSSLELAFITVVIFLKCVVTYHDLIRDCSSSTFGEKSQLMLVEVFTPGHGRNKIIDPSLPVLTTVSSCRSVKENESQVVKHFSTASKIWQRIHSSKRGKMEKEFFSIINAMKPLNIDKWEVFQEFSSDFRTYSGDQLHPDQSLSLHTLKQASLHCSMNNYKTAAKLALKGISELAQRDGDESANVHSNERNEDYSFFNCNLIWKSNEQHTIQRRVHFLSQNRSELISYATNILIYCLYESLEITSFDDRFCGHLLVLLQLEWPSAPGEMIFNKIIDTIRGRGSFHYSPFFGDFVIEPDFLEVFGGMWNQEGKRIKLDLWSSPTESVSGSGRSRKICTRRIEKGTNDHFQVSMKRQMLKNGRSTVESLVVKFLMLNKDNILILNMFDNNK